MKTKSKLPLPVALMPPLPAAIRPPARINVLKGLSLPDKVACRGPDPEHRFHAPGRPGDSRPVVAAGGAMVRVRSRRPEFHKQAAVLAGVASSMPAPRQIHGGLVSKRRAGK